MLINQFKQCINPPAAASQARHIALVLFYVEGFVPQPRDEPLRPCGAPDTVPRWTGIAVPATKIRVRGRTAAATLGLHLPLCACLELGFVLFLGEAHHNAPHQRREVFLLEQHRVVAGECNIASRSGVCCANLLRCPSPAQARRLLVPLPTTLFATFGASAERSVPMVLSTCGCSERGRQIGGKRKELGTCRFPSENPSYAID